MIILLKEVIKHFCYTLFYSQLYHIKITIITKMTSRFDILEYYITYLILFNPPDVFGVHSIFEHPDLSRVHSCSVAYLPYLVLFSPSSGDETLVDKLFTNHCAIALSVLYLNSIVWRAQSEVVQVAPHSISRRSNVSTELEPWRSQT